MRRPTVRMVAPTEIEDLLPALVDLLRESVNGGASLGFLPPVTHDQARRYWRSLRAELRGGSRLLFVADLSGRPVGSGQLALPPWPNARHRAEVHKLMVSVALRGHGIGRRLVHVMHDAAWQRGRPLLLLNTRRGDTAETFYQRLGYRGAGVIPGYTVGPAGEAYDNVAMYQLLSRSSPPSGPGRSGASGRSPTLDAARSSPTGRSVTGDNPRSGGTMRLARHAGAPLPVDGE